MLAHILLVSHVTYTPIVCRQLDFTHTTLSCVVAAAEFSSHRTHSTPQECVLAIHLITLCICTVVQGVVFSLVLCSYIIVCVLPYF